MPETSQPSPSRNPWDDVETNADGSVDLYFSPTKAKDVNDQTWRPDSIVKLK